MSRGSGIGDRGSGIGDRLSRFAIRYSLFAIILLLAACGGPPGGGTPTALPPGARVAQPTPLFEGNQPTPSSRPNPARGEQASNSPGVEEIQSRLATRIAQSRGADAPPATPTRPPLADLRSAASASVLNRPSALGIVAGGANLAVAPNGGAIGFLPAGATVTITGRSADGGWYAVYLEDSTAGWLAMGQVWVFGDVNELEIVGESIGPAIVATLLAEASRPLGPIEIATATPIPRGPVASGAESAPVSATGPSGLVLAEGLNVRAGPGTDFPVIGAFAQNERVTLLARNEAGDWVEIALPGGSGWVYAPLLQPDSPVTDLPVAKRTSSPPAPQTSQPQAAPVVGLTGRLFFQSSSGGAIYRYDLASGGLQQITTGADPAISPDGQTVAFVRGGGEAGIYLINRDGSNERRIVTPNAPSGPAWSPDGQFIAFSYITGTYECYDLGFGICITELPPPGIEASQVIRQRRGLARVNVNGGDFRDIPSLENAVAPDWHAWGIVYQSGAGPQITQDGPGVSSQPLLSEYRFQDPDWQPVDGRIAFQSREGSHWEIFVVNPDGSGLAALTRPQIGFQPHSVAPAWSPDGRWIVFLSNRSGEWRLWVMEADGGNQQALPVDIPIAYNFQAEQVVDWGR
ncbi:MAG: PD40 domain-containing protein [Caldilineaceae bacterium]|nr:PD40 domain-containing protein [Caldilineaceae bacterium]